MPSVSVSQDCSHYDFAVVTSTLTLLMLSSVCMVWLWWVSMPSATMVSLKCARQHGLGLVIAATRWKTAIFQAGQLSKEALQESE